MFTPAFLASKLFFLASDVVVCRAARQAVLLGGELQSIFAVELGLADEFFDAVGEALRGICLGAGVGGSFGADQERDFAAGGAFFEGSGEFGELAAAKLFVELGHFARDAGGAIAEDFARVGNTLRDPVWRFVKDDGAVLDAQSFDGPAAFAPGRRHETSQK